MSTQLSKKSVARNYAFLAVMLGAMILGSIVGWIFPQELDAEGNVISAGRHGAGTSGHPVPEYDVLHRGAHGVFVHCRVCGYHEEPQTAGKIMGTTVLTFVITGAIAAVIMIVIMKIFPPVLEPWTNLTEGVVEDPISIPDLIVNFFTVSDFSGLLSRSAMLPLIVFSILFGFGVNLGPGPDSLIARFLTSLSEAMMKVVQLVTYYAPIAFFGFFANLVATYGSQIATDYARALVVYYPLCFIYIFVAFPLFACSAAARERSRKCSGTSPNLPSLPWAPAPPWPPSPPTWKRRRPPVSPRMSARSWFLWAPPCTWMAPASLAF